MIQNPDKSRVEYLVRLAAEGNEAAFGELIRMYKPMISGVISRFFTADEADDLRQEADIAFYLSVKSYHPERNDVSFGLYSKICITNRLLSTSRKQKNRITPVICLDRMEEPDIPGDADADPLILLSDRESYLGLENIIKCNLSDFENRVFRLYLAGFTPAESAVRLNRSEKSVSNALYRIRGKLKGLLKDK